MTQENSLDKLKALSQSLREKEKILISHATAEHAVQLGQIGIWDWHPHNNVLRWNSWMYKIFNHDGQPGQEMTYDDWISNVHSQDRERVDSAVQLCGHTKTKYAIIYKTTHDKLVYATGGWAGADDEARMLGICIDLEPAQ